MARVNPAVALWVRADWRRRSRPIVALALLVGLAGAVVLVAVIGGPYSAGNLRQTFIPVIVILGYAAFALVRVGVFGPVTRLGYPFLVAMLYAATGRDFLVPLVANAVFGGGLSLAVYFLARQSLSDSQALLAAAGVAIDPFLVFWSAHIITESLGVLLVVLCLITMAHARERQSLRWALLCGLLCGVAMLVRGNLIVLPLAYAAWNLPRPGLWRQTLSTLLCTFLVVFSVTMFGVQNRPSQTQSQWERAGSFDGSRRVGRHGHAEANPRVEGLGRGLRRGRWSPDRRRRHGSLRPGFDTA
jgi:hypothetical protein